MQSRSILIFLVSGQAAEEEEEIESFTSENFEDDIKPDEGEAEAGAESGAAAQPTEGTPVAETETVKKEEL